MNVSKLIDSVDSYVDVSAASILMQNLKMRNSGDKLDKLFYLEIQVPLASIVLMFQLRLLRVAIVNDLAVKRSIVNAIRVDKNVQVNANVKDVKIDFIIFTKN